MSAEEKLEEALTEQHDKLLGLRRRLGDRNLGSHDVWRVLLQQYEENLRDSFGTADEDYWTAAVAVARRHVMHGTSMNDLTERRFT